MSGRNRNNSNRVRNVASSAELPQKPPQLNGPQHATVRSGVNPAQLPRTPPQPNRSRRGSSGGRGSNKGHGPNVRNASGSSPIEAVPGSNERQHARRRSGANPAELPRTPPQSKEHQRQSSGGHGPNVRNATGSSPIEAIPGSTGIRQRSPEVDRKNVTEPFPPFDPG